MFGRKTEPINEFDQRAAELAQQRKDHAAIRQERARLKNKLEQAATEEQRARDRHSLILGNVDADVDISDADREDSRRSVRAARSAKAKAAEELAAHEETHGGDLAAREKQLRLEEEYLEQERIQADHREDVKALVQHGCGLADVQARILQRCLEAQRKWPNAETLPDGRTLKKGAALPDVTLPAGFFEAPDATGHAGENVIQRLIWPDHVLRAVAEAYPDLLPPDQAKAILDRIASDKARGAPRWYPRPCTAWDIHPSRRLGS